MFSIVNFLTGQTDTFNSVVKEDKTFAYTDTGKVYPKALVFNDDQLSAISALIQKSVAALQQATTFFKQTYPEITALSYKNVKPVNPPVVTQPTDPLNPSANII